MEAAGTMAVSTQQVLNGISELKVSQEDNFSSIKGKLDNHEERLRCLEKATNFRQITASENEVSESAVSSVADLDILQSIVGV